MATLLDLLDDLREMLDDESDAKYSRARKVRWLNRGQQMMWPSIHRIAVDSTLTVVADTFEYLVPATLNEGMLLGVEVETESDSDRYWQLDGRQFDFVPGGTGQKILKLRGGQLPVEAGSSIRLTVAMPLTELSADGDTFSGPARAQELPVLYAMGIATETDFEGRLRYKRFSTTQGLNGTDLEDFHLTAQYWFDQFDKRLAQVAMALPTP